MRYAQDTTVSVERSKGEIERILQKYGATEFASGWRSDKAMIQFKMNDRYIRFTLPLPMIDDFDKTPAGRRHRTSELRVKAWEQACRQRWRALGLSIKAKLESAESGIETFEHAFMGQIIMPDGKTVGEMMTPMIDKAYKSGKMPNLMLEY